MKKTKGVTLTSKVGIEGYEGIPLWACQPYPIANPLFETKQTRRLAHIV